MVFYFTDTGNSLYVARELDENCVSIPQLSWGNLSFEDKEIGIVCPLYGGEAPAMVQRFLKEATFKTDYLYIIMTYRASAGNTSIRMQELVKQQDLPAHYFNTVLTVDNYLPGFDTAEINETHVDEQIAAIKKDVVAHKHYWKEASEEICRFLPSIRPLSQNIQSRTGRRSLTQ